MEFFGCFVITTNRMRKKDERVDERVDDSRVDVSEKVREYKAIMTG